MSGRPYVSHQERSDVMFVHGLRILPAVMKSAARARQRPAYLRAVWFYLGFGVVVWCLVLKGIGS